MFEQILVVICGLGAAASFIAFIIPYLNRMEQRERVMDVIAQRRKSLYTQTREDMTKKKTTDEVSAAQSVNSFFRVEKLAGDMARKIRVQLQQAGYRSQQAVVIFLVARITLPIVFILIAMMFLSASEKEIANAMQLLILMVAAFAGYSLPKVMVKNQAVKRMPELNLNFPDALDLMLICVQGGIGIEPTIDRVAKEMIESAPILAEELGLLSAELGLLSNRKEAFTNFASRVGNGAVKNFANAMIQAEQYGTGVSKALRVLSDDIREERMAAAEQKAASLPPKLTVPMIIFFLPALFIVILGPAVIRTMAVSGG